MAMEKSILKSTKKALGIHPDDPSFDEEIAMHINSVFATLQQLGVGPETGFMIEDAEAEWSEFEVSMVLLNQVKNFIFLSVKILFDPATSPHAHNALIEQRNEKGWRLQVQAEDERAVRA